MAEEGALRGRKTRGGGGMLREADHGVAKKVFKHDEKDEPGYVETGMGVTQIGARKRSSSSVVRHTLVLV